MRLDRLNVFSFYSSLSAYLSVAIPSLVLILAVKAYRHFKQQANVKRFKVQPPDDIDPQWDQESNPTILKRLDIHDKDYPDHITSYDPATGRLLSRTKPDTPEQVQEKIQCARTAQKQWKETTFEQRISVLRSLKHFIVMHQEEICRVSARVTGKTLVDASLGEIMTTLAKIDWLISHGKSVLQTEYRSTNLLMLHKYAMVEYHPLGVVGAIISWNYPFHNAFGVIVSAIFAGNGVIIKASEHVCHSTKYFESIIQNCLSINGHNPQLVQFLNGEGNVGEALVRSNIDKITFIGSPKVGKLVMKAASDTLLPVVLELGGKDAAVVRHDADLNHVIPLMMRGTFQNAGQNCVGIERLIVHSSISAEFIKRMRSNIEALTLGRPLGDKYPDCGAITMCHHPDHIQRLVDDAIAKGARCEVGGRRGCTEPNSSQSYFQPTLLTRCTIDMKIATEEVFGPVMCIYEFDTDEEAIELVNAAGFGLGGSVFSKDTVKAQAMAQKMKVGMMNINDFGVNYLCQLPFGGVGQSGFGRFGGIEGLRGDCSLRALTVDRFPSLVRTELPKIMQYPMTLRSWKFSKALIKTIFGLGWMNVGEWLDAVRYLVFN